MIMLVSYGCDIGEIEVAPRVWSLIARSIKSVVTMRLAGRATEAPAKARTENQTGCLHERASSSQNSSKIA
jgi:hypothetical protein